MLTIVECLFKKKDESFSEDDDYVPYIPVDKRKVDGTSMQSFLCSITINEP